MRISLQSFLPGTNQRFERPELLEPSAHSTEKEFSSPFNNSSTSFLEDTSSTVNSSGDHEQFQLSTIDIDVLKRLIDDADVHPVEGDQDKATNSSQLSPKSDAPSTSQVLSDDIIRKFVTPSKNIKKISEALEKIPEPRKCALKLLPFFFSDRELSESNTDGTHGKPPLDPVKLNSLKVLLFMRFIHEE
ncbi:uncharacterized protein LOC114515547 [Dendronephthya gigantea]|uniref:uncharacterized protein LOC114515547 n=1 Tax=Dendronephthya gigantea TaxID=151771 RepID=UPI00106ACB07|nr:uncharacterized protein LOC114515547 [Dendronephthya gigantea]